MSCNRSSVCWGSCWTGLWQWSTARAAQSSVSLFKAAGSRRSCVTSIGLLNEPPFVVQVGSEAAADISCSLFILMSPKLREHRRKTAVRTEEHEWPWGTFQSNQDTDISVSKNDLLPFFVWSPHNPSSPPNQTSDNSYTDISSRTGLYNYVGIRHCLLGLK